MKPKEYLEKYDLTKSKNHNLFLDDLTNELLSLLEVGRSLDGELNIKTFENSLRVIRQKWDAISNKIPFGLTEGLWEYFYATKICKIRKELFPEVVANREKIREEKQRRYDEYKSIFEEDSFFDRFQNLFKLLSGHDIKPIEAYTVLGFSESDEVAIDDVSKRYRELSLKCHPDRGGSQEQFIKITEAKNRVINFINR